METLLRIGLSNAVAALLLALLVVTVACIWRRPAVLHALWLLVLIKLVTPPLVWLPEPWTESAEPASPVVAPPPTVAGPPPVADTPDPSADAELLKPADAAMEPVEPPAFDAVFLPAPSEEGEKGRKGERENCSPSISPSPLLPFSPSPLPPPAPVVPWWVAVVFGVWLAGALGWYTLALVRLRRFRRLLRHAVPAPESLRQRTHRLAEKLGLRGRPAVWLVPGRVAPMLWAVGGPPRILFPAELLGQTTPEQQNALLVHELAHLRRRDHWVRWLEFVAAGLYWWNPVLWFARRELREAEEHCCDAWVTSTLPGAGKTYAVALLETLDFLSDAPPAAPLLASSVGRVADLKRRLTMIMNGTTPRALGWRGMIAVLGIGVLLLPLLPAWARGQAPATPAKPDAPPNPDQRVIRFVDPDGPAASDDADKARAELKELEAKLEQKKAETAELVAKVEALRAKVGKANQIKGGIVIAADAQDLKYEDLLKWLQAAQAGGPAVKVIVIDKATGKIILEKEPNPPAPPPPAAISADKQYILRLIGQDGNWVVVPKGADPRVAPPVAPPNPPVPPPPAGIVRPGAPAPTEADKRIDELEKKLKSILDEVEQLRRERRPDAKENETGLHSYGPAPLEQIPYIRRLFKVVGPEAEEQAKELAAARDALHKYRADLKGSIETEKARDAALEQAQASVAAAEATLKQGEARCLLTEVQLKTGNATAELVKQSQAEVAAQRAALEVARANLEKARQDKRAQEDEVEARLKDAAAARQAAEAKVKQLEEQLQKLKEATNGEAPKKQ